MGASRLAVVTGGTRGIGAAISRALKHGGYRVIATYVSDDASAQQFKSDEDIEVLKFDVCDFEACMGSVASIESQYGHVDVLVNNAGVTRDAMLHKMSPQQWHDVILTNLTSCFNMSRAVIEGMRERRFGRIINITSVNGLKGQAGQTNYSAAKAGIIGLTKALALETAPKGITVNAVAPGYISTDMVRAIPSQVLDQIIAMIPVGRLGTPEEIARSVFFLASDYAGFITGATFSLNGGQHFI